MDHCLPSVVVALNEQEAAIIYYIPRAEPEQERVIFADLQQTQSSEQASSFGAAIGTIVNNPEEIADSYQMAKQADRYHFYTGRIPLLPIPVSLS